jgi:translation initiation factor IF-3
MTSPKTPSDAFRVNQAIRCPKIRVIDAKGEMLGVMTPQEGIKLAQQSGLDLVEVSPTADPPVCKLLDYGKFKYENQKKRAEARKKQKVVEIKEIKIRPVIDINDYQVKLKAMIRFLEEGNKVKVTMRFRGREITHQELGMNVLKRIQDDLTQIAKVEQTPKLEGKQVVMMLGPIISKI